MYSLDIAPELDRKLIKLIKKDRTKYEIIMRKASEIVNSPHHYKNLRAPMQRFKRVHINSHFVLVFSVDESTNTVVLEDFDHHDSIYK